MAIDLRNEEIRGEEARQILQSPLYQESWTAMRETLISKLETASLSVEERKTCNDLLIIHGKARKYMENVLTTGKMAEMELEKQRTLAERAASMFNPARRRAG